MGQHSIFFNITRKLYHETLTLPLVSMMFSDNETLIHCTENYNFNLNSDIWIMNTLTTRLHIIEPGTPNYGRF